MIELHDRFRDDKLIRIICEERIRQAEQRSSAPFSQSLTSANTDHLRALPLPPRRRWHEFRPLYRAGVNADLLSLIKATMRLRISDSSEDWVQELERLIGYIQYYGLESNPCELPDPRITPKSKGDDQFRPLSTFNLYAKIVIKLVAEYIRDALDKEFQRTSYAFRARDPERGMPTHHLAFEELYGIRKAYESKSLYVAECDIRGFYDTVNHSVATEQFLSLVERARPRGTILHPRAIGWFLAYLQCYSFPENVLMRATPALQRKHPGASFPWPADALQTYYECPQNERIGVPQGGALSCIIANIVLDLADRRVRDVAEQPGAPIYYFRYCDDMILVSPDKRRCAAAYQEYLDALKELKLPYHEPFEVQEYDSRFWKQKSKSPYQWTGREGVDCVPWVQFVGYQIRYDGLTRVSKKARHKHLTKLRNLTDRYKYEAQRAARRGQLRVRKQQLRQSLQWTMIAVGVGKRNRRASGPQPFCWAGGFKQLQNKPFVATFLMDFDRQRERQLARFGRANIREALRPKARRARNGRSLPYVVGRLFSYYGQFTNKGGTWLINHPYRPWNRLVRHWTFVVCARLLNWLRKLIGRDRVFRRSDRP